MGVSAIWVDGDDHDNVFDAIDEFYNPQETLNEAESMMIVSSITEEDAHQLAQEEGCSMAGQNEGDGCQVKNKPNTVAASTGVNMTSNTEEEEPMQDTHESDVVVNIEPTAPVVAAGYSGSTMKRVFMDHTSELKEPNLTEYMLHEPDVTMKAEPSTVATTTDTDSNNEAKQQLDPNSEEEELDNNGETSSSISFDVDYSSIANDSLPFADDEKSADDVDSPLTLTDKRFHPHMYLPITIPSRRWLSHLALACQP
ncbi:hypothetical protein MBANPS3_009805 [Mucor bainieri]